MHLSLQPVLLANRNERMANVQVSPRMMIATAFCKINVTLHDICSASICMVSAGLNCRDFIYFFDRAGCSNSKLFEEISTCCLNFSG